MIELFHSFVRSFHRAFHHAKLNVVSTSVFFFASHRLTVILNLNSAICLITVLLFSGFFNEVTNNWYRNRNFFRSYRALSILLLFSNHFYHMVSNWLSIGLLNCIFQFVYLAAHHNRSHQNTFDKIRAVLKYYQSFKSAKSIQMKFETSIFLFFHYKM